MSSEENWKEAIAFTVKRFGGLTTLVNNGMGRPPRRKMHRDSPAHVAFTAGIGGPVFKIENQTLDAWNKLQSINTAGPMLGMKAASEALHKAGKGASVVNVSSVYAICGAFGEVPAYHGNPEVFGNPTCMLHGDPSECAASKGAISALCAQDCWPCVGIKLRLFKSCIN